MNPKVSIIILNWNGLEDTTECLESLKKITYPNYEVILVDNGSEGNDVKVLRQRFGDYIHIIENDKNYGFAEGNNIAIRWLLDNSKPDYFLLLNNDTVVAPEFLTEMVKVGERELSSGIIGPKIYCYHFSNRIESAGARIDMCRGRTALISLKQIDVGQHDKERQVDYALGCCLLIKRQVIEKVGLLDESYFCYWEDADYCVRAKRAGYKIVYAPHANIWHKLLVTLEPWYRKLTRKHKIRAIPHDRLYYTTRNNFKFMRKYATRWQYYSFLLWFFGYYFWFMTGVCFLYHRDIKRLISFYRGVRNGLFEATYAREEK